MPKFVAVYADDNGESQTTIVTADDGDMPFGAKDKLSERLENYNPQGNLVLVEVPDDWEGVCVDADADDEIVRRYVDLT